MLPPGNRLRFMVEPSRPRITCAAIRRRTLEVASIDGSSFSLVQSRPASIVGCTTRTGPGAASAIQNSALVMISEPPIWALFMKVTRRAGCQADRQSMISVRYGVRELRHLPECGEVPSPTTRYFSAHADGVIGGSRRKPARQAPRTVLRAEPIPGSSLRSCDGVSDARL